MVIYKIVSELLWQHLDETLIGLKEYLIGHGLIVNKIWTDLLIRRNLLVENGN
jgi:hypothetical protein